MLQNIIFALIIIFLMAGAFFWMWKLSKWLVIPIQIILFSLLMIVIFKVFVTRDNAEKLNSELEKSGIAKVEEAAVTGTLNAVKSSSEAKTPDEKPGNEKNTAKVVQVNEPANNITKQPAAEPKPVQQQAAAEQPEKVNLIDLL